MSEKQLSAAALAISADLVASLKDEDLTKEIVKGNEVYVKHAEAAGFTMDQINGVKAYDRTFAAGTIHATATVAVEAIKAGQKLDTVNVTWAGAKGEEFTAKFTPKSEGVIRGGEGQPDKPWTSYGKTRVAHKSVVSGKAGDLGVAMSMAEAAAEAVMKK